MKRIVILKEKRRYFLYSGLYCEIYSGQFFRNYLREKEESIKVEFGLKESILDKNYEKEKEKPI